jgi:hypothetical protein
LHPATGRIVKALVATVGVLLSGCAIVSQPPRPFAAEALDENGGAAYLWSVGKGKQPVFSMQDFAIVTRIDDKPIPSKYRPDAGIEPLVTWRIDIPAGRHVIEIVNKECVFSPFSGIGGCTAFEKSSNSVEFTAAPRRAYTPIVDERCGHKWFWIVDGGQLSPAGPQKMSPIPFMRKAPAVGGVAPPEAQCPAPTTDATDSR